MAIHPTAVVDKHAEIDPSVDVGAYAIIERGVCIEADTRLYPHAYVSEGTTLGQRCQIHPFAVVGHLPQDLKYDGAPTFTRVGDDTVIREHASIHRGTAPGSTTVVGKRCFIMATGHVGHNCVVGDDVKIVNCGLLAGHVEVGNAAFISGNAGVHQFVRIGELVMVAGATKVVQDVPPFMVVTQYGVSGMNVIGLRRAGMSREERGELAACFRVLYRDGLRFPAAIERVTEMVQTDPGRRLAAFLQGSTHRGYAAYRRRGRATVAIQPEVS